MISSLATLKTIPVEELMLIKSVQAQSSPIEVWRGFTVQLSSLSLDHGTKLRAPLQLTFGLLCSEALTNTQSRYTNTIADGRGNFEPCSIAEHNSSICYLYFEQQEEFHSSLMYCCFHPAAPKQ
ncbi:hypothetical protein TNCV_2391581 [Trichonephila clavipes]|nr:hypothetical protein TNCV_2391581 [Trichonephila clavipes]